jgi:hypothetical protein
MLLTDSQVLQGLDQLTVRARASAYLTVAESLWPLLNQHPWISEKEVARKGLDLCWAWVRGEPIDDYELYNCHAGDSDLGTAASASSDPNSATAPAWSVADDAICFVLWKDLLKKNKHLPADIENMTEETILETIRAAEKVPYWSKANLAPLKQYLQKHYPASNPDDLGPPISKDEVMQLLPTQAVR